MQSLHRPVVGNFWSDMLYLHTAFHKCSSIEGNPDKYSYTFPLWVLFNMGQMFQVSWKNHQEQVLENASISRVVWWNSQIYLWPLAATAESQFENTKSLASCRQQLCRDMFKVPADGFMSWSQTFHHQPTQPLVVTRGSFQVCVSICVHPTVLTKCSWMHDYARGMRARQRFRSCLSGTQDLKAPEVSCFRNRYHVSHSASPYRSPNINKLSPWKGEIWGIIAS